MCLLALLALLGFATASLLGCGNNGKDRKLLSHASASKLQSSLDVVEQMVSEGDSEGARSQAVTLQQQVDGLPRRTNRKLRKALAAGTSRLVSLVDGDCRPATTTETTPTVPPTTTETTPQNEPPGQQKKDKTKPEQGGKGKQKGNEQGDGTQTTPDTGTGTGTGTTPGGQGD
jgi:hypothetical protein